MGVTAQMITRTPVISLPRTAISQVVISLNNGLGAFVDALSKAEAFVVWGDVDFWDPWGGSGSEMAAHFSGRRISYMTTLHNLTNAPCRLFEVFAGVTTEAAFNAQLALRTGSPLLVFELIILDIINGDTHTFLFSERALDITGLYEHPVFTGVVESHETTLNRFDLILTDTQKSENREIPELVVRPINWPNAGDSDGEPYPIVYGKPGSTIDADKIGANFGAAPALLVDPTARKYLAAGHALVQVAGQTNEANAVDLFVRLDGYDLGLGYIEGFNFDLSALDTEGNIIATVTHPNLPLVRLYIPVLGEGTNFTTTASDADNVTGRDAATEAELEPGEIINMDIGAQVGSLAGVHRVHIKTSKSSSDLRARWSRNRATVTSSTGSGPKIDNADGWDESGNVEIGGTVYAYTSITFASASDPRLDIAAYGGPSSGTAVEVGAWQTLAEATVEVTDQRDWNDADFGAFELEVENTSGSTTHSLGFLGFLVELGQVSVTKRVFNRDRFNSERTKGLRENQTQKSLQRWLDTFYENKTGIEGEPPAIGQMYVPCFGKSIIFNSINYGASRNPAVQLSDVFISLLGFSESELGDSFESAISITSGWNLDFFLATIENSLDIVNEIMRQSRLFMWRDGENNVQLGVLRQDASSDLTLTRDADVDDPDGDALLRNLTPENSVYNRVYLRWGPKGGGGDFENLYYITESDSFPPDLQRQGLAATSQAAFRVTRTLERDASFIRDADTALRYLQFLFDWHRTRRNRIRLRTPMHTQVVPGRIVRLEDSELGISENFLIEDAIRSGDSLDVKGIAINLESGLEESVGYGVNITTAFAEGWGSPNFWDPWGGSVGTQTAVTAGRVVDYGLSLLANRHFEDTAEKITHGAWGDGVTALDAGQVDLTNSIGVRVGVESDSRSGTEVTIVVSISAQGTARTIREVGLFTGGSGSNMVARVVFASDISVGAAQSLVMYFRMTLERPSAGTSGITDYGLDLFAQRVMNDTAEKPTHMAIGDDSTAQDGGDVALVSQIAARVAIHTDFPQHTGLSSDYRGDYPAATYGGNTVVELGIFSGISGNNAIVRRVPTDAIPIGALEDFIHRHKLTTVVNT